MKIKLHQWCPMNCLPFLIPILFCIFSGNLLAQVNSGVKSDFTKIGREMPLMASNRVLEDTNPLQSFDVTISGIVTDQNGQPIPGATVLVQNTTIGVATDLDGKYT